MKNKIAMVVFSYYPNDPRVRRETDALVDVGNSVDVFCLSKEGEIRKEQVNSVNVYRMRLNRNRGGKLSYLWGYSFFIISIFLKLTLLFLKKRYDVIHVHNVPNVLVLVALFPWVMGAKIILDMHEIMPEFFMRKYNVSEENLLIKVLKSLELFSVKFTSHVIVATPFLYETVTNRSTVPEKCTTVLNLPDPKFFNSIVKNNYKLDGNFKLVYPGTLSEQHGIDIAIKAIGHIKSTTNVPVELHIYGPPAEQDHLISLTQKLGLQNSVLFHSLVPYENLGDILKNMDLGIVPKRDGVFIGEAISTKLFEYAIIGLPAVVSDTKGDSLYFDDSMVMFFEPENEKDLADCIIKLYHDVRLRKSLGKNAKSLSQKQSWETSKQELYKVYNIVTDNL